MSDWNCPLLWNKMLAVSLLLLLPVISGFKTGYIVLKEMPFYSYSSLIPHSPYTINQHLHQRQVWRTGSSAMCVWALTQAVVYMTLTIGRERLTPWETDTPKLNWDRTAWLQIYRWHWGQMCPRYNDKCVKVYYCTYIWSYSQHFLRFHLDWGC